MIPAEDVPRLRSDEEAIDELVELEGTSVNRGVVLDGRRVVGILSAADLGRALEAGPRRRRVRRSLKRAGAAGGRPSRWA